MKQEKQQALAILLAGVMALAACVPGAPTQDPAELEQQIKQAVALTVAAQNAQATADAALAPQATNTTLPTQTEAGPATATPILPTATPFVIVPPTTVPSGGGGGGGSAPVKAEYSCDVIRQRPLDNSYWKRNKDFDIRWTIVNTGTKAWVAGLDLVYFSGYKFTTSTNVELPAMAPGDQYEVIFDGVTPSSDGFYVMTWKLEGGFCYPYIAIYVEQ